MAMATTLLPAAPPTSASSKTARGMDKASGITQTVANMREHGRRASSTDKANSGIQAVLRLLANLKTTRELSSANGSILKAMSPELKKKTSEA